MCSLTGDAGSDPDRLHRSRKQSRGPLGSSDAVVVHIISTPVR